MTIWKCLTLQKKRQRALADYHLGIVREGKVMLMMKITDMEKMQEVMTSDEMKAWDEKFNCVDEIYSLEIMN